MDPHSVPTSIINKVNFPINLSEMVGKVSPRSKCSCLGKKVALGSVSQKESQFMESKGLDLSRVGQKEIHKRQTPHVDDRSFTDLTQSHIQLFGNTYIIMLFVIL